jgi:predicted metal-binding membrane protein
MASDRASGQAFCDAPVLLASGPLFAASAAITIVWCTSMSAMGEMPMPGGWTMSMAWMRMPGQTWLRTAASFVGMWIVMMVAMMLPSLAPRLWRYREAVGRTGETRLGRLTALVGVGYFLVWTVFGIAVFPLGVALAAVEMQHQAVVRAVPIAVGVVVLPARYSSPRGRHITLPAAGRQRGAAVRCGRTPALPGDKACASASTVATAVPG